MRGYIAHSHRADWDPRDAKFIQYMSYKDELSAEDLGKLAILVSSGYQTIKHNAPLQYATREAVLWALGFFARFAMPVTALNEAFLTVIDNGIDYYKAPVEFWTQIAEFSKVLNSIETGTAGYNSYKEVYDYIVKSLANLNCYVKDIKAPEGSALSTLCKGIIGYYQLFKDWNYFELLPTGGYHSLDPTTCDVYASSKYHPEGLVTKAGDTLYIYKTKTGSKFFYRDTEDFEAGPNCGSCTYDTFEDASDAASEYLAHKHWTDEVVATDTVLGYEIRKTLDGEYYYYDTALEAKVSACYPTREELEAAESLPKTLTPDSDATGHCSDCCADKDSDFWEDADADEESDDDEYWAGCDTDVPLDTVRERLEAKPAIQITPKKNTDANVPFDNLLLSDERNEDIQPKSEALKTALQDISDIYADCSEDLKQQMIEIQLNLPKNRTCCELGALKPRDCNKIPKCGIIGRLGSDIEGCCCSKGVLNATCAIARFKFNVLKTPMDAKYAPFFKSYLSKAVLTEEAEAEIKRRLSKHKLETTCISDATTLECTPEAIEQAWGATKE